MEYKKGSVVQVRAAGTNQPALDGENLWEVVRIDGHDCSIRNMYDEYRANTRNSHTSAQQFDTSMLLPWKGKLPVQFR